MPAGLEGKRVLIVEDEFFIAAELRDALIDAKIDVIGPVGRIEDALRLAETQIDAAILDVNLEGAFSYPIADRLIDRQVPFLFVTGYDGWALPDSYRAAPRLAKPFTEARVIARLHDVVAGRAAT